MMITPEMMEQLGGKRGKARGPDMTNREIGDADGQEDYGGAASLEEAVGDWEGGRKRKRLIKTRFAGDLNIHTCIFVEISLCIPTSY